MTPSDNYAQNAFEVLVKRIEAIASAEGGPVFMERWPNRWYDEGPRWRCVNEHVSRRYLKCEERGALCLACMQPLCLTFPEDVEGPLPALAEPVDGRGYMGLLPGEGP